MSVSWSVDGDVVGVEEDFLSRSSEGGQCLKRVDSPATFARLCQPVAPLYSARLRGRPRVVAPTPTACEA
jgi:hypothetical protein